MTVFGVGRVCHIAFWEPHFAAEYDSEADWKAATHRLGAKLHPLTVEQNAITSFKSRTTLVPAYANTIGPGLFLQSDRIIGGCDGVLGRGMQWQGFELLDDPPPRTDALGSRPPTCPPCPDGCSTWTDWKGRWRRIVTDGAQPPEPRPSGRRPLITGPIAHGRRGTLGDDRSRSGRDRANDRLPDGRGSVGCAGSRRAEAGICPDV